MKENSVPKILRMNPKIFLIWIFMISISMIFVSLISAYIVKKGEPVGFNVDLPSMFYYSTIVVILSSIFIYILSGVHAFHLISGLIFILYIYNSAIKLNVHSKNLLSIEMSTTYWHFLAGMWVYLFITLYFYNI